MEQHPVPQQISAYHFRLVGDMTIKQFLELAGGIVIAWIVYSLPLPALMRWPVILFSVVSGIALAFLPFEGRPLDRWFFAFMKAIYSPTNFIWKKSPIIPSYFEARPKPKKRETKPEDEVDRKKLKSYLETLPELEPQNQLDIKESNFISNIMKMYMEVQPTTASKVTRKKEIIEEKLPSIRVRKLRTPPIDPHAIMRGEVILPKARSRKPKRVSIPKERQVEVDQVSKPLPTHEKPQPQDKPQQIFVEDQIQPSSIPQKPQTPQKPSTPAITDTTLPFPTPPTEPNVLVGMVVNNKGNIIENAIITIKDSQGNIARAQKTNKIGQFFIATPLENNKYQIEVEVEGHTFDIINIELKGEPVPPIEIRAKE